MLNKESMLGRVLELILVLNENILGVLFDLLERLNGRDGDQWLDNLKKFLRGEIVVPEFIHRWREQDGIIYCSVTSDGITASEWLEWFEKNGYDLAPEVKSILRHSSFNPTSSVTYEIAIFRGMSLRENECYVGAVRNLATQRNLIAPSTEVACLIRKNFSDQDIKDMNLWGIFAMCERLGENTFSSSGLIRADRNGKGNRLSSYYRSFSTPSFEKLDRGDGFAFIAPQSPAI